MLAVVPHARDRFVAHAQTFLLAREADHALLLGLATDPLTRAGAARFWTVDDDGTPLFAAMLVPPRPLLVGDGLPAAAIALADAIAGDEPQLSAVNGPMAAAEAFASRFADARGVAATPGRRMRLHSTRSVAELPRPNGRLRAAEPRDLERLADWYTAFHRIVGDPPPRDAAARVATVQDSGRLFVWDDGEEPRSMAAWTRPTSGTVSIHLVYTPAQWRGRGYATACVAGLTRERLADGVRECLLFTDVDNPISNAIYARIGYRARLDFGEFRFGQPSAPVTHEASSGAQDLR